MWVEGCGYLPGQLVVVSGPSGCGKSTIIQRARNHPETKFELSISATTRKPRPHERNGFNYHFMNKDEFESHIDKDDLLEYATYNGEYYGTAAPIIFTALNENRTILLEIEVEGAKQVREKAPEALFIFVTTPKPSVKFLGERLRNRGTESEQDIFRRLQIARHELAEAYWYDYQIINDDLDRCVDEFVSILKSCGSGG